MCDLRLTAMCLWTRFCLFCSFAPRGCVTSEPANAIQKQPGEVLSRITDLRRLHPISQFPQFFFDDSIAQLPNHAPVERNRLNRTRRFDDTFYKVIP